MTTTNAIAAAWGAEIATRRAHYKLTRAELAEELQVSRQMVRLWETGVHAPSSAMQAVLIEKLGIDPDTLTRLIRASLKGAA